MGEDMRGHCAAAAWLQAETVNFTLTLNQNPPLCESQTCASLPVHFDISMQV